MNMHWTIFIPLRIPPPGLFSETTEPALILALPLDPTHIKIGGLAVTVENLPVELFAPGTSGFKSDPSQYTWNLWPRLGLIGFSVSCARATRISEGA
jgi:hypothetical protein